MLDESDFKPFSLTDFTVVETESAETVDSSAGNGLKSLSSNMLNKLIDDYYVKRSHISGFDTKREIAE
jgi:hypothetical protein